MKISGQIYNIIYENKETNFKILNIDNSGILETVKGTFPFVEVGDNIECQGKYIEHKDFGLQFDSETFTKIFPDKAKDIEEYLSSGVIKGVGPKTAENIVKVFGEVSLDIIYNSPEKLEEIKGISKSRAIEISDEFRSKKEIFNLAEFLKEYNFSMKSISKIYDVFKGNAIEIIKENPYILIDVLHNASFKDIDKVALAQGISPLSENRIIAIIKYVINIYLNNGHTIVDKQELIEFILKNVEVGYEYLEDLLNRLEMSDYLAIKGEYITLASIDYVEEKIVERIIELENSENTKIPKFDKLLEKREKQSNIVLTKDQIEAIKSINENNISIITGGPGTGKTTILEFVIDIFEANNMKVSVAAPTGKAAKRIVELTGHDASTVHRLLNIGKFDEDKESAVYHEVEKLDTDLLIIDEASMLDIYLFNYIIKSLKEHTKLAIIGDVNQLPSVGPGKVLADLIDSNVVNSVYLKEIFRQAKLSDIVLNAHRVNNGQDIEILKDKKDNKHVSDMKIIEVDDVDIMFSKLMELLNKEDVKTFFEKSIILSPTKKGVCGTINLNQEIQRLFNRNKGKNYGKIEFKKNDRVMQIKNNYDLIWEQGDNVGVGVFNGDTGKILNIDEKEKNIKVQFDDGKISKYLFSELDQLLHSYVMTVHKSQGSEFDKVILVLPHAVPSLLTRNILYTAMSRAKKELIIIGSKKTLKRMINTVRTQKRKTALKNRLIKEAKEYEEIGKRHKRK